MAEAKRRWMRGPHLKRGPCEDAHLSHALSLRQIQPAVQEGTQRELARPSQPCPSLEAALHSKGQRSMHGVLSHHGGRWCGKEARSLHLISLKAATLFLPHSSWGDSQSPCDARLPVPGSRPPAALAAR